MTVNDIGLRVPGDKSITHRALILAALAAGRSRIVRPLVGADTRSTAAALRALGCVVPELSDEVVVDGVGLHGLREARNIIDCGNSGTTARLLMGALAGCAFASTLTGDASLTSRPMRRVTRPLSLMGATFEEIESPDRLPIRIHGGALRPLDYQSPQSSAQVKSAILLAGLTGSADVSINEPVPSRDHTERMLSHVGVRLIRDTRDDGSGVVTLSPVASLDPFDLEVPGDPSSAAFLVAYGLLAAAGPLRIRDVGLNPTRTGFFDVVRRMGARLSFDRVHESCGEPIGDIIVEPSTLTGTRVGGSEIPSLIDEIPVLAILAARASGTTVIEGATELRVKECDRIRVMVENLTALGVPVEELPDGLVVHGPAQPTGGTVSTHGDHRIAMAFGVLSAATGGAVRVDDRAIVDVSFPGFWDLLATLAGSVAR